MRLSKRENGIHLEKKRLNEMQISIFTFKKNQINLQLNNVNNYNKFKNVLEKVELKMVTYNG